MSLLVIGLLVSVLFNVALIVKVNVLRNSKNRIKRSSNKKTKESRELNHGLVKASVSLFEELEAIKQRLKELEDKYDRLSSDAKELEERVFDLEEANSRMANHTYKLIKEDRIIKSKFLDTIFTYKFRELTTDEILNFFGRLV